MGTYRQIFYHVVFSTKHREPTLTKAHCKDLYNYIFGVTKAKNCTLYRINGVEDHIHLLSDLHPSLSLSSFVKDIKLASSDFMKSSGLFPGFTHWQEGYGAFTHSVKEKDSVIGYIKSQKEHHKKESFVDEYKRILSTHEIQFEEKYLF